MKEALESLFMFCSRMRVTWIKILRRKMEMAIEIKKGNHFFKAG